MHRPPNPTVPVIFAAISVSGVVFAIVGGSSLGMVAVAVAVVAGVLAIAAWRHTRAISAARPATERWWLVLVAGVGALATTIVVLNVVGEVPDGWWWPMMLTLLAGVVTTAAGLILGIVHLIDNRPRRAAG
jgi:hypothetical protein